MSGDQVASVCQGCGEVTLHRFRGLTLCTDCEREVQKMLVRDVFGIGPKDMFPLGGEQRA